MIGDRSERYDGGSPRSNLSIDNETEEMAEEESITVGRKRASRMRIMREKMTRYSDMRKEKRLQPVVGEIEVERVKIKRVAQTRKGDKYLKAGRVDNKLVQDKYVNQVVGWQRCRGFIPQKWLKSSSRPS